MNKPRKVDRQRTDRQKAERKGRLAEWIAAARYMLAGGRILARRYKTKGGEADLIVLQRGVLIIVEVKRRDSIDTAIEAVTPANRRRVERAGVVFRQRKSAYADMGLRYDICALAPGRITLVKDAWRDGE